MDNFSRLENEHREFFKLPKLPYVLGNTTSIVLALDKNTSDNQIPFYSDKIDINGLYNFALHKEDDASKLMAYKLLRSYCYDYPVSYEENISIINGLQPAEYEQFIAAMDRYFKLEIEFQNDNCKIN